MKPNYNENIFIANKDDIYNSELVDDSYRKANPDENYVDIFNYANVTIEYDFKSGKSALYLQKSKKEYEILYESSIVDGIENSSFYSRDNAYILTNYNHNTGDIERLECINKTDFIQYLNKALKDFHSGFMNSINKIIALSHLLKNSTTFLIINNKHYEKLYNNLYKEYRKLFVKYRSATTLIPAYSILYEIISTIHKYISTGNLDTEKLNKNFLELQSFKDVCNSSISLISSFIHNPHSIDLRNLCDALGKNLNNVNNLINLYLEDELNLQNKENENDCK